MKHSKEPWSVDEVDNDGDYGDGPNPRNGFKSFAICDGDGNILFDSLNRDSDVSEIHEDDHADEYGHLYAWDDLAKQDARRIVACVNACRDIDIGVLESDGFPMQLAGILALKMQRDELLAALEGLLSGVRAFRNESLLGRAVALRRTAGYVAMCDAWDAAIAKAEGRS